MNLTNIKYFLKEGGKSFFVNWTMSLACVIIVTACLLIFGMYMVFSVNLNSMGNKMRSEYEISVFISRETSDKRVKEIGKEIESLDNVSKSTLVPKKQGLEMFEKEAVSGFENDNPLPDSYTVTFKNLDTAIATVDAIKKIPEVYKTTQSEDTISAINLATRSMRVGVIILMALMIVISVFIISNTIKLTVFARRRDINIMKFVGATDWFIRWPFIIEGVVIGLVGACVAFLVVWYGYSYISAGIGSFLSNFNIFTILMPVHDIVPILLSSFLSFGILIGGAGSVISVRRHLHV